MEDEADDIFLSLWLSEEDLKTYDKVMESFEHFIVRRNGIYERAKFNLHLQKENELADDLITSLYSLAEHCEYGLK